MKINPFVYIVAAAVAVFSSACSDDDNKLVVDEYAINISGDSNGDFFVDGKSWVAVGDELTPPYSASDNLRWLKFTVVGDTVVGGIKAKKIQSELTSTGEKSSDYRIGYENKGVVYIWLNDAFRPLMDYRAEIGKQMFVRNLNGTIFPDYYLQVSNIRDTDIEGHSRKQIKLQYGTSDPNGLIPTTFFTWTEGIGCNSTDGFITDIEMFNCNDKFWNYREVFYVYQDGKCIFNLENNY